MTKIEAGRPYDPLVVEACHDCGAAVHRGAVHREDCPQTEHCVWLVTGGTGDDGDEWHVYEVFKTLAAAERYAGGARFTIEQWRLMD